VLNSELRRRVQHVLGDKFEDLESDGAKRKSRLPMPHPHEAVPRHPPDQPFELEHAERGHDLAGGHAGAGDQVVDRGWPVV
jgi:hypothetical protein